MPGRLYALVALAAVVTSAQAQPGLGFGLLSLAEGQGLRVNALNLGTRTSTPASGCEVTLQFLDDKGTVLRERVVRLLAGRGGSLELHGLQAAERPERVSVRAVLLFGSSGGGAPPGPDVRRDFDCNIVPTLELFDEASGRTTLVVTDAKPLPLPDQRLIGLQRQRGLLARS